MENKKTLCFISQHNSKQMKDLYYSNQRQPHSFPKAESGDCGDSDEYVTCRVCRLRITATPIQ